MTDDDARVFRALSDPTRRFLLDRLFVRDGRTLGELESGVDMTRFGVMKHLRLLEDAGLVVVRRQGREKLHFLNPVPIRLLHDRWIDKYTEREVSALTALKAELEGAPMHAASDPAATTQVHRVFIRATADAIWTAITSPEWTERYGYRSPADYELTPGGAYRGRASAAMREHGTPDVLVDGEVIEVDPPHRLVQTWRFLFDEAYVNEGHTRLTWEIAEVEPSLCRVTVTHELQGAPNTAAMVGGDVPGAGGGWAYVLSDLKTLLETGSALEDPPSTG